MKILILLILDVFLGASLSANSREKPEPEKLDTVAIKLAVDSNRIAIKKTITWQVVLESNLNFGRPQPSNKRQTDNIYNTNSFQKGSFEMRNLISSLPTNERTVKAFTIRIKQTFSQSSFEEKLGALAYLNNALYDHYDSIRSFKSINPDDLVANLVACRSGEKEKPELIGTCRDYAFLTSKIAEEGFGLKSSVIRGHRHLIAQVVTPDRTLILINEGKIITNVDGQPLRTKDDGDIAIMRQLRKPAMKDIIIDPVKNAVVYENRNNFAGFWKKLQNRDNSDRLRSFLMNNQKFVLFSYLNERGATYGSVERGNWGLQAYWVRDNNQYNRFLEGVQGLNLAFYLPTERFLNNPKLSHVLFTNFGFYRTVMNLWPEIDIDATDMKLASEVDFSNNVRWREKLATTLDMQINIEDYLKYSLNTHLSLGLISKLIQYNQELFREGGSLISDGDGYAGLSPFISWEISQKGNRTYFCAGSEITDYLALPNPWRLNAIPWFQVGFTGQKQRINLDVSLRGEFQRASQRFDWMSYLNKNTRQLEFRAFFEHYTQDFKEHNLFKDGAGIEIGITQYFKKGRQIFVTVSGKTDNCGAKSTLINLGVKF